jgi:hypothetical protein
MTIRASFLASLDQDSPASQSLCEAQAQPGNALFVQQKRMFDILVWCPEILTGNQKTLPKKHSYSTDKATLRVTGVCGLVEVVGSWLEVHRAPSCAERLLTCHTNAVY